MGEVTEDALRLIRESDCHYGKRSLKSIWGYYKLELLGRPFTSSPLIVQSWLAYGGI